MNKVFRSLGVWLLLILILITVFTLFTDGTKTATPMTPAEFEAQVQAKNVKGIVFYHSTSDRYWLEGQYDKRPVDAKNDNFTVELNSKLYDEYPGLLKSKDILDFRFSEPKPNTLASLMSVGSFLIPIILVVVLFFFIMQQTQGSGNRVMQFGRSRARLHTDSNKRITFEDVAGIDEVKEELVEIVDFLKHPKRYMELGARIPKGVLLYGAPGTGKTLLAKAVAGEAGVPFFSISGSDFVEMFVGVGASRVRDLFEQAKKNAPCIVFIDEIDAVGRQRGAGYGGGHDEREQTLNQLLVEMDGFGINEGVIIIAATNRPDVLDPALLRPGRFDRQIVIDHPDINGRKAIFAVHAKGKPLDSSVDLDVMAKRTPGFTGADIQNLMNEAALLAARKRKRKIDHQDLDEAIDRIIGGGPEKKSRVISDKEKKLVAWHEAGHAVTGFVLPGVDTLHKVTIVPRGRAGGYALFLPDEDKTFQRKQELLDRMVMTLGGRAAEEIVFGEGEISNGASSDIEKVTSIARRMVTEWGMSEKLGPLAFGIKEGEVFLGRDIARQRNYSEEIAAAIDDEVRTLVNNAHQKALDVLRQNRKALDHLAETLLVRETLDGEELRAMLGQVIKNDAMPAQA